MYQLKFLLADFLLVDTKEVGLVEMRSVWYELILCVWVFDQIVDPSLILGPEQF
jgi:hypothetical protein